MTKKSTEKNAIAVSQSVDVDPLAKSLFERLPVPVAKGKELKNGALSLTAAFKGNSGTSMVTVTTQ